MSANNSTTSLPSLSVFFPCYNEAESLPLVLNQALQVLPQLAKKFEIIVVDDGSSDQTRQTAQAYVNKHSVIKVVSHSQNLGYGAAVRTGIKTAKYDWLFYTDGDGQFNLRELKQAIALWREGVAVLGYRKERAEGARRAILARLYKLYIDLLFRVHVKDIDCAFKLFKTEDVQQLALHSNGAFISAEILYKLKKHQVVFKQLAVNHYPRRFGSSTGASFKVILVGLWEPLKLYLRMKFGGERKE